jgi:hypothetical protein
VLLARSGTLGRTERRVAASSRWRAEPSRAAARRMVLPVRPAPGEWDSLRLAAKAADRGKAAEKLRPAFEKRLKELGYSGRAIAHAFSALVGPATVTEALAKLAHYERLGRIRRMRLAFEIVEEKPALPLGHSLTITTVERDGEGIRICYVIRPPLSPLAGLPRAESRDDREHEYSNGGGFSVSRHFETAPSVDSRCLCQIDTLRCCVCA